jgi:bifunctional DNA-binding transcriptional regulator/antitoxin component of YhaV-PrlF toxin-antitoxin module
MARQLAHAEVRLGPQGRLVIPAALRRQLGVDTGDSLVARIEGAGRLVLEKRVVAAARLQTRFAAVPRATRLAEELIAERRREAAEDAKK